MNKYKVRKEEPTGPNVLHEEVHSKPASRPQVKAEPEYRPRHNKWPAIFAAGAIAVGAYYAGTHHIFENVPHPQQIEQAISKKIQTPPRHVEVVNHYITKVDHVYTASPVRTPQQSTPQQLQYRLQNQQQNMQYKLQEQQLAAQKQEQQMQYRFQLQQMQAQQQAQQQQIALQQQQQQMQYQIQQQQMAQQGVLSMSYAAQNFGYAINQFR